MSKRIKSRPGISKRSDLHSSATERWKIWCSLASILAIYIALRLPGIDVPLDRDEGAFGYMGQLIRDGKLPYLDGLDHKPPVAFYINALALCFVPPTEQGIHLFLLIYNLLTLGGIFFLAKVYFRSVSHGLWAAFVYAVFSSSPSVQGFTASTEMWMLLPITLSLLLGIVGARKGNGWLLLASGASGSAACWIKPPAFTSILFVFLLVIVIVWRDKVDSATSAVMPSIRAPALWLAGALCFTALPLLYFFHLGLLGQLYYWSFQHNAAYAGLLSVGSTLKRLQPRFAEILRGDFFVLSAGLFGAVYRLIKRKSGGIFVFGFFLLSFLGTIPGFGYRHYFAQLAPAVALAGGCGLATLVEFFQSANRRLAAVLVCAALVLATPVVMNRQYFLERDPDKICRRYFGANPFPESKALAAYIDQNTTPTDPVFIVGSEPQILFYAERKSPSAFLMAYPMTASYPRYREFQDQWWRDLQNRPPKYVLNVVNLPATYLWDGKADIKVLNRINDWLRTHYEISGVMAVTGAKGGWIASPDSPLLRAAPCVYVLKRRG